MNFFGDVNKSCYCLLIITSGMKNVNVINALLGWYSVFTGKQLPTFRSHYFHIQVTLSMKNLLGPQDANNKGSAILQKSQFFINRRVIISQKDRQQIHFSVFRRTERNYASKVISFGLFTVIIRTWVVGRLLAFLNLHVNNFVQKEKS